MRLPDYLKRGIIDTDQTKTVRTGTGLQQSFCIGEIADRFERYCLELSMEKSMFRKNKKRKSCITRKKHD